MEYASKSFPTGNAVVLDTFKARYQRFVEAAKSLKSQISVETYAGMIGIQDTFDEELMEIAKAGWKSMSTYPWIKTATSESVGYWLNILTQE